MHATQDKLIKIARILIWIGVIGIFVWAIGKSIGIIRSPVWVNMLPYFFGAGGLFGVAVYCGKLINRIDYLEQRFNNFEQNIKEIEGKIDNIIDEISNIKIDSAVHTKELNIYSRKIEGLEKGTYNNLSTIRRD